MMDYIHMIGSIRFDRTEIFTKKPKNIIKKFEMFNCGSPWQNRISSIEFGSIREFGSFTLKRLD
jgi:hypothetical protein